MRPYSYRRAPVLTISSLMPFILDDLPGEMVVRLVEEHLLNEAEFWLPYGLPSVAAGEPSFEPDFRSGLIWRGPTRVNTNWFLAKALQTHGCPEVGAELIARTVEMLERAGMRECFNPYTAEGYSAHGFGWSTLVLDLRRRSRFHVPRASSWNLKPGTCNQTSTWNCL